jgi:hypothetical protein
LVTLQIIPQFWFAFRNTPISLKEVILGLRYPLLLSVIMAFVMLAAHHYLLPSDIVLNLIGCSLVGGCVMLLVILGFPPIRFDISDILDLITLAFGKRQES